MRARTASVVLLSLVVAVRVWGDDELPIPEMSFQPASSTFLFSDEEPPFQLADNGGHASISDYGSAHIECGSGACDDCGSARLLGFLAASDSCFTQFVSPVTNPFYFENPRTLTEARMLFFHHRVPLSALGGQVNLLALQLRAALTDRLSLIATKDGFISSSSSVIEDGWADINLGLKYNLLANPQTQRLLSVGMRYELPVGSTRAMQGNGGGMFDLFVTGGFALRKMHVISASGLLLPANRASESSMWFWSNHLSRRVGRTNLHVLGEVNWYHWMGAGEVLFPLPIEGLDLFNIGSAGVAGNDIATGAFGCRYKPSDHLELGIAWEAPLTQRRDILDNRLTVDCVLRY